MSRRTASLVTTLLCAAALSACGTGLHARTYQETGRVDGANADLAGRTGIAVRNLHVVPPASGSVLAAGTSAFVTGGLVNGGSTADQLLSATSDVAGNVSLLDNAAPTGTVEVPALGAASQTWALQLGGLIRPVAVGSYINVTLVFAHAGHVDLRVPVQAGDNGLDARVAAQDPYAEK